MTFLVTKQCEFLSLALIVVASRHISYTKIKKFYLYLISILYGVNLLLVITQIKRNDLYDISAPGHKYFAYTLGFQHPNNAMIILLGIFLWYILIKKYKLHYYECFIFILLGIIGQMQECRYI